MYTMEQLRALPGILAAERERLGRMCFEGDAVAEVRTSLRSTRLILEGLVATGTADEVELARAALADVAGNEALLAEREADERLVQARREIDDLNMNVVHAYIADEEPELRIRVVRKAVEIDFEAVLPLLHERLDVEADRHVATTLIKSIGLLGRDGERDFVAPFLEHKNSRIRANALEGLSRCKPGFLHPHARRLLQDPHHRVRLNAALILEEAEPGLLRLEIDELMGWDEPLARAGALWAASRLSMDDALMVRLAALDDADPAVRIRALEGLGGCDDPEAAATLAAHFAEAEEGTAWQLALEELLIALQGSTRSAVRDVARGAVERTMRRRRTASGEGEAVEELDEPTLEPRGTLPPSQRGLRAPTGPPPERKSAPLLIRVAGRVVDGDKREPVKGVAVRLANTGFIEVTDRLGRFGMERLEGNRVYVFVCEKIGFPTTSYRYRASAQADQSILIRMRSRGSRA